MKYIDTDEKLKSAVKKISAAGRLALDTEADSLHRYFEKLCLLQVSASEEDYVIDPLVGLDLGELVRQLERKPLILHGADFDLRLLWRFYQLKPKEIFDSLLAAQILGLKDQSLASLVRKYFGIHLPKVNQKADWSKRPLTSSMIEYAANDIHYLHDLAIVLEGELRALGRWEWFEESCSDLIQVTRKDRLVDRSRRWRVKGSHALSGRELVLLKALWEWREEVAQKRDRPSFKVLHSEVLVHIAKWGATHPKTGLRKMDHLPRHLDDVTIKGIERRLEEAWQLPPEPDEPPAIQKESKRLSEEGRKKLLALKEIRKRIADDLKCDPGILAPNAALEAIVLHSPRDAAALSDINCLKNWQVKLVGPAFLDILNRKS